MSGRATEFIIEDLQREAGKVAESTLRGDLREVLLDAAERLHGLYYGDTPRAPDQYLAALRQQRAAAWRKHVGVSCEVKALEMAIQALEMLHAVTRPEETADAQV